MSKREHERTGLEVEVSAEVLAGLEAARDSGAYNMLQARAVADWCYLNGHTAASDWIRANSNEYTSGIFHGFVAVPPSDSAGG